VNRDEEIGARVVGDLHALAVRDEIIAIADQHGAHAGLIVDLGSELLGDGEHYVLFARAASPEGAGVLAAVAGVDHDDDLAAACRGSLRRAAHDGRCLGGRQVDDEAKAV
jgi:hypothetical protein